MYIASGLYTKCNTAVYAIIRRAEHSAHSGTSKCTSVPSGNCAAAGNDCLCELIIGLIRWRFYVAAGGGGVAATDFGLGSTVCNVGQQFNAVDGTTMFD